MSKLKISKSDGYIIDESIQLHIESAGILTTSSVIIKVEGQDNSIILSKSEALTLCNFIKSITEDAS